jgi:hypothetical protein
MKALRRVLILVVAGAMVSVDAFCPKKVSLPCPSVYFVRGRSTKTVILLLVVLHLLIRRLQRPRHLDMRDTFLRLP